MEPGRDTTVLFANLIGGAELQASAGNLGARQAMDGCVDKLRLAAESRDVRVVKTMRDKLMMLAATPDAAADAAAAMQYAMEKLQGKPGIGLGLGVAFHRGPVIQRDNDVFGGTVNLAARLAEQAAAGNILTTEETAKGLCPLYRKWMRSLAAVRVRGISGEVELCELLWRLDGNVTAPGFARLAAEMTRVVLRLRYRDQQIVRRRQNDEITIGRDEGCGLVIAEPMASRQHCKIERRVGRFVLIDHSANGTYVSVDGEDEVLVRREEFTLYKQGRIAFGQPAARAVELVEFRCDEA
jgi:class 3 adenylate cyclase